MSHPYITALLGVWWLAIGGTLLRAQDLSCSREARARDFVSSVPCDLMKHGFCDVSGQNYPWRKLRKFVFENQAIIKRMYGYEKHSQILKEEFERFAYDENDVVHPLGTEESPDTTNKVEETYREGEESHMLENVPSSSRREIGSGNTQENASKDLKIRKRTDRSRKIFSDEEQEVELLPHPNETESNTDTRRQSPETGIASVDENETSPDNFEVESENYSEIQSTTDVSDFYTTEAGPKLEDDVEFIWSSNAKLSQEDDSLETTDQIINLRVETTTNMDTTTTDLLDFDQSLVLIDSLKQPDSIETTTATRTIKSDTEDYTTEMPEAEIFTSTAKDTSTVGKLSSVSQTPTTEKISKYHPATESIKIVFAKPVKIDRPKVRGQSRQPNRPNDRFNYFVNESSVKYEHSTRAPDRKYQTLKNFTLLTIKNRTSSKTNSYPNPTKKNPTRNVPYYKPYSPGFSACPVETGITTPYWANNTRGEPRAILNLSPFDQFIHWEKCRFEYSQADCRTGCRCEQQYRLHRMLAFDPYNDCRGVFSDWFKFPSGCICRCYSRKVHRKNPRKLHSLSIDDIENDSNDQHDGEDFVNSEVIGRAANEDGDDLNPASSDLTDIFFESEDELLNIREEPKVQYEKYAPQREIYDNAATKTIKKEHIQEVKKLKPNKYQKKIVEQQLDVKEQGSEDVVKRTFSRTGDEYSKLLKTDFRAKSLSQPSGKYLRNNFYKAAKKRFLTSNYKKHKFSMASLMEERPHFGSLLRKHYFIEE